MTEVRLHGILSVEFGDSIFIDIDSLEHINDAIECNRNGFKKRVISLHKEGFHYAILVNGKLIQKKEELFKIKKIDRIDFVPVISGCFFWIVVAIIAVAVVSTLIALATVPDPPKPPEISQSSQALSNSFRFQNSINVADQGASVPLGYGELILGSQVIMSSKKVYSLSRTTRSAYKLSKDNDDSSNSSQNHSSDIT